MKGIFPLVAERTGRTKSYYLRGLIANGIDDLERYYTERVRKGEQVMPAPPVKRAKKGNA